MTLEVKDFDVNRDDIYVINRDQRDGHEETVVHPKNEDHILDGGSIHSRVVSSFIRRKAFGYSGGLFGSTEGSPSGGNAKRSLSLFTS